MARNRTVQRKARKLQRQAGGSYNAARDQIAAVPPRGSRLTRDEWLAAGRARFGTADITQWSVLCPNCGHITTVARFLEASGATEPGQAFAECLGRHLPGGGPRTFPCNWAAWGFTPLFDYTVVDEERECRVFAFPAPDDDIETNRARHAELAATWQAADDAAAAAEEAAEEDQEEDEGRTDLCEECDRPVGRRHRLDCIWRAEEVLGEWEEVDEVHTWADGQELLSVFSVLAPAVEAYANHVGQLLKSRGVRLAERIGSPRADARVEDGYEISADCDVTLHERNTLGGLEWFSWDPEHGWSFASIDPAERLSPVRYAGGAVTPSAEEIAERIIAVLAGREQWTGERVRHRAVAEPRAWRAVAQELTAAAGSTPNPSK